MIKRKNIIILSLYLIITLISIFFIYLSDFEFNSVLSFLNFLFPIISVVGAFIIFIYIVIKFNKIKNPILKGNSILLSFILVGVLISYFWLHILFALNPGSSTTITAPDGVKLVFVSYNELLYTHIEVYRSYGIIRKELNKSLLLDDLIDPIEEDNYEIKWGKKLFTIYYPRNYKDIPKEKWEEKTIQY